VHPESLNSMAVSGSALVRPWLALGGPFLSSYAQMDREWAKVASR